MRFVLRPRAGWVGGGLLGALAFAAVIVSHEIAFRLAAPDPHARADLLAATGHRYFSLITGLALGLLLVTATRFLHRAIQDVPERNSLGFALPRLLPAQLLCFMTLEGLERMLFGDGLGGLVSEPAFTIGLGLQLVLALLGALSLLGVVKVVAALARRPCPSRAATGSRGRTQARLHRLVSQLGEGGAAPRAPPVP